MEPPPRDAKSGRRGMPVFCSVCSEAFLADRLPNSWMSYSRPRHVRCSHAALGLLAYAPRFIAISAAIATWPSAAPNVRLRMPQNFNFPTVRQHRRVLKRWHISLSTWMRDYLYISLAAAGAVLCDLLQPDLT